MTKPERFEGHMLVCPTVENTLHEYIFQNEEHARQWLAQPFTQGGKGPGYGLALVSYALTPCCSKPQAFPRIKTIDLPDFLRREDSPPTPVVQTTIAPAGAGAKR